MKPKSNRRARPKGSRSAVRKNTKKRANAQERKRSSIIRMRCGFFKSKEDAARQISKCIKATGITRSEFLRFTGISAVSLGAAAAGLSKLAAAQAATQQQLPPGYDILTLAAVVDAIVPTTRGKDFPVYGPAGSQIGLLPNVGSSGTSTKGALDAPSSYIYLYSLLPKISHEPGIVNLLVGTLDQFARTFTQNPEASFKDLDYDTRYQILYMMDKPDLLVESGVPIEQAAGAKQLLTPTIYLTFFIYYSEVCNVTPHGYDPSTGLPVYKRDSDNKWSVLKDSPWNQINYPGPSYKEPSYSSTIKGLKVTIADGKVKFIQ